MVAKLQSWLQQIKKHRVAIGVVGIGLVVVIMLIIIGYWFDWTGFNGYNQVTITRTISGSNAGTVTRTEEYQPGKSIWDWLQLLIIPLVLAVGALLFNFANTRTEQKIAAQRYEQDQQIALDKQRQDLLQTYLDRLSELLLKEKLRSSEADAEVRNVARARTLTVLPQLDAQRKGNLIQFLSESKLLEIISLSGANLSGANLSGANLNNANLTLANLNGANLSYAILNNATLSGATLSFADLSKADLSGATLEVAHLNNANLTFANLNGANLNGADLNGADLMFANQMNGILVGAHLNNNNATLSGAHLNNADLSYAILNNATLSGAILNNATLSGAHLSGADLKGAGLKGADLWVAHLSNANLINANLINANLNGADLTEAKVTEEQLAQAKSLTSAIMPDGTRHP